MKTWAPGNPPPSWTTSNLLDYYGKGEGYAVEKLGPPFSTGSWPSPRNSWPATLFASFRQDDIGGTTSAIVSTSNAFEGRERREGSSTVFNVIEGITSLLRWWTTTSLKAEASIVYLITGTRSCTDNIIASC